MSEAQQALNPSLAGPAVILQSSSFCPI